MRRAVAGLVVAAVTLAACGVAGSTEVRPERSTSAPVASAPRPVPPAAGTTAPPAGTTEVAAPELPAPAERIPRSAERLAHELEATSAARRAAVRSWVVSGGTSSWPPPRDVELLVLHEQLVYRVLAAHDRLARRVLAKLDGRLVREARANVEAGGALYDHFAPVDRVPDFRTRPPLPADTLRAYFRGAQRRFGVDWEMLAAVMLIETRMGRIRSNSSAGAQGPMQFIPSTWAAYGLGGDVQDEKDAIMGAANYLRASGAPEDDRQALYQYNPVDAYVTAVLGYAAAMRRDPELFFAYYNWQVFVRTTRGDVRLTGPGLER